jgi:hypothetical protein
MKSIAQAALELKRSRRHLRALCDEGRVVGAEKIDGAWVLPDEAIILPPQSKWRSEIPCRHAKAAARSV